MIHLFEEVKGDSGLSDWVSEGSLQFLVDIFDQNVDEDPDLPGECLPFKGVVRDRIVSSSDPSMRHGRKSSRTRFDGHKVQAVTSGDHGVVVAVRVVKGNEPDGKSLPALVLEAESRTESHAEEIHVDRAYDTVQNLDWLSADPARSVDDLICKPRRITNRGKFPKTDFHIDLEKCEVTCPESITTPVRLDKSPSDKNLGFGRGGTARFPASVCHRCRKREFCLRKDSKSGRSIRIHAYEDYHRRQRDSIKTPEGRKRYRSRTRVEHVIASLMNLGLRQARYVGIDKTQFQAQWVSAAVNIRKAAFHQMKRDPISTRSV